LTAPGTIAGTPGFMAPEQRDNPSAVDARADVYALGALLVAMLAGHSEAYDGDEARRLSRVPMAPRLRAICARALAVLPSERYADAAALGDEVARFRAGLPVAAYRESALERLWRLIWTYRTPILLVVAYLVMRTLVALYTGRGR
jgi:serine/threonine protein kinase